MTTDNYFPFDSIKRSNIEKWKKQAEKSDLISNDVILPNTLRDGAINHDEYIYDTKD